MLLVPCYSHASVHDGVCRIDRKFHSGATLYAGALDAEVVCLVPETLPGDAEMDVVEVPLDEMPYRIEVIQCDRHRRPQPEELPRVDALVRQARALYGRGFGTTKIARRHGVPYVIVTECNLRTNLRIAKLSVDNPLRALSRQAKVFGQFATELTEIARAHSVHCNGYPTFDQSRRFNSDCLLFFDSRMSESDIISESQLERRLDELGDGRRPRLLYSGRYTKIKGALDVIKVGLELAKSDFDFELNLYGAGDLQAQMTEMVKQHDVEDKIRIHDAVAFPELVKISACSDLFVCCHVQDDPSCTYLETFGAGMPIVGYDNAMWRSLATDSEAGVAVPSGGYARCAKEITRLLEDHSRLREASANARDFAERHCFEKEFEKRVGKIRTILE